MIAFSLTACLKDGGPPAVNDSIYGRYFKDQSGGDWTDFVSGIRIIVEPVNSSFIKITLPEYNILFDSAQLVTQRTFTIDETAEDNASSTGFSKVTGQGSFGSKTMSLVFTFHRDSSSSFGDWTFGLSDVPKVAN